MPLNIKQKDMDMADSIRVESGEILLTGISGATPSQKTIAGQNSTFNNTGLLSQVNPPVSNLQGTLDLIETISLAIIRLSNSFPTRLPSFTISSLPAASDYIGAMIFVSDAAGGSIPAFSDGSNWLRVDTRAVVT